MFRILGGAIPNIELQGIKLVYNLQVSFILIGYFTFTKINVNWRKRKFKNEIHEIYLRNILLIVQNVVHFPPDKTDHLEFSGMLL